MGYLTEAKLVNIVDNPVALPATEIKQGDWLVLATIKIASPMVERDTTETVYSTPGNYSWIIANNMQPSSSSDVPTSTEINFRLSVTGQVRLELDSA